MTRYSLLMVLYLAVVASPLLGQEVIERESGTYATETIRIARPVAPKAKIEVASAVHLSGSIKIVTHTADSLVVEYRKVAKASSRSEAIDFIDLISVVSEGRAETPVVKMRAPNPAPWSGTDYAGMVELELIVPSGAELEIEAPIYDLTARGPLRALDIPESLGKMEISGITERLNVSTANRRVTLSDIKGQVSAVTSNSSLLVENLSCPDEQARFRNDGGDIDIVGVVGTLNVRNSYGRISIEKWTAKGSSSYIRGTSGPVAVEITSMDEGQLVISNRQEDIEISVPDTLSAFYTLSVDDDGIIEASNFSFTPDLVEHNRLNLVAGDGRVDIRGSVKGKGNIFIRGKAGE
ncbi:MAG: hypothetical protein AB1772_07845 [Candidatus Zixiibacteriota bacterium]